MLVSTRTLLPSWPMPDSRSVFGAVVLDEEEDGDDAQTRVSTRAVG
jgi:hypothetical protein